jgi:hypothetical protein
LLDKPLDSNLDTIIFNDRIVIHEVPSFVFSERGLLMISLATDLIVSLVWNPLLDGSDMKVTEENGINDERVCNKKSIQ